MYYMWTYVYIFNVRGFFPHLWRDSMYNKNGIAKSFVTQLDKQSSNPLFSNYRIIPKKKIINGKWNSLV